MTLTWRRWLTETLISSHEMAEPNSQAAVRIFPEASTAIFSSVQAVGIDSDLTVVNDSDVADTGCAPTGGRNGRQREALTGGVGKEVALLALLEQHLLSAGLVADKDDLNITRKMTVPQGYNMTQQRSDHFLA